MIDRNTAERLQRIFERYSLQIEVENRLDSDCLTYSIKGEDIMGDMFLRKLSLLDDMQLVEPQTQRTEFSGSCEKCNNHKAINDNLMFCEHWHNFTEPKGYCYKFEAQKPVDNSA